VEIDNARKLEMILIYCAENLSYLSQDISIPFVGVIKSWCVKKKECAALNEALV